LADASVPDNSQTRRQKLLHSLIGKAGFDFECNDDDHHGLVIERLTSEGAFCNEVFSVRRRPKSGGRGGDDRRSGVDAAAVVKLFTPLALARMEPSFRERLGSAEELAAHEGLGPRVLAAASSSSSEGDDGQGDGGIVTEFCNPLFYRPLPEVVDLDRREARRECRLVGEALARLHSVRRTRHYRDIQEEGDTIDENMLWRSCDTMLDAIDRATSATVALVADRRGGGVPTKWTAERLRREVERQKARLRWRRCRSSGSLPTVQFGHGDFKASNILLLSPPVAFASTPSDSKLSNAVQFIDLELAGTHYRGFDLAKLFRTDDRTHFTEVNELHFLEAYAAEVSKINRHEVAFSVDDLKDEAKALLPMTWLEAAIFFVCMTTIARDDSQGGHQQAALRWDDLAAERLRSYKRSLSAARK